MPTIANQRMYIDLVSQQIERMTYYLLLKVDQHDWHGVADAAMDIRELERELKVRREFLLESLDEKPAE